MNISLSEARIVVAAAIETAESMGKPPIIVTVVDAAAHPVAFSRMDGVFLGAIDVAQRKARTAALFQLDSAAVGSFAKPGEAAYTIEHSNGGLIGFGGGIVLRDSAGNAVGAVGVSGGSIDDDEAIAAAAAEALLASRATASQR